MTQVEFFSPWTFAHGFANITQALQIESAQSEVKKERKNRKKKVFHRSLQVQSLIAENRMVDASNAYDNVNLLALNAGGWFNPSSPWQFGFPDFSAGWRFQVPFSISDFRF